jgi:membrane protein DedA with SNARE-associated domain
MRKKKCRQDVLELIVTIISSVIGSLLGLLLMYRLR